MTHDYKRHGTTTPFAALKILDGTVLGRNVQRHRHQEFIPFLNALERDILAEKKVHVILDNYAAHKHDKVRAWPARVLLFIRGGYRASTRRRAMTLLGPAVLFAFFAICSVIVGSFGRWRQQIRAAVPAAEQGPYQNMPHATTMPERMGVGSGGDGVVSADESGTSPPPRCSKRQ